MTEKTIWRTLAPIVVLLLVSVIFLVALYMCSTPTQKDDMKMSLFSIIAQGATVGLLGMFVKSQLEQAAKNRDEQRRKLDAEATRAREVAKQLKLVFNHMITVCRETIRIVDLEGRVSATGTFAKSDGHSYDDLLAAWEFLEPQGAHERAREAYETLRADLKRRGGKVTDETRLLIKDSFGGWMKYYKVRLFVPADDPDPPEPKDWRTK